MFAVREALGVGARQSLHIAAQNAQLGYGRHK